ncbi:MAG: HAMP domain-containing histidine kinase [Bacteroidales bacterium]|nr:HAMP domain-containing histidine kinase [Clostridium sp.]MCM1203160.1 HAMP domain-containing histidine kinase [Bacteroidales bacterium]
MATKWKNIIKKAGGFLKRHWKILLGVLFTVPGLLFCHVLIAYRGSHYTGDALFYGAIANIFLGLGTVHILGAFLEKKYGGWLPVSESYYREWRKMWKTQQLVLAVAGIIAGIIACWYFSYMAASAGKLYYYGHLNYASGYVMVATVMVQYGICQVVVIRFMLGKLGLLMEHMEEINRENLARALEIERKSLEKVSRSDQLRVDLITNVSHDLKTPLTSMVGYIELMKKEELNGTARDYLEVISDKAGRLREMIESLFSLAKASSGNIELHVESLDLNRLIEQIFADMEDRIKESDLQFVKQLAKEDTTLISDNLHLYRICQNLIENALKYSAKGTRVFVKTICREEMLCMEVTNTAGYFMDFNKEDIVERFARADEARTSDGSGLGLAIVSAYTAALGGEFDISIDCDQFKAKLMFPRQVKGE